MKARINSTIAAGFLAALILIAGSWTISNAADFVFSGTVVEVKEGMGKNEAPYTRAIVTIQKNLDGVNYDDDVVLMGFGEQAATLAAYTEGQEIECIAEGSEYQGRTSYRVKAFK